MPTLEKAKLQKVRANEAETPIGDPIPVQFNPTTLKLKLTNQVEGGRSTGRQRRQQTGNSSNVLSMELIFDSADEGTPENPVSVRSKTALVEQFVIPPENNPDPPARLKFEWQDFALVGIVESVDITFEHFAANGAPLRAKVSLSIKEQEPKYQFLQGGAGSRDSSQSAPQGEGDNATAPGAGTNEPGGGEGPSSDQSAPALEDESPAEFAARQGLDPSAWRGLDADLGAGLGLQAGVEVGFSAGLNASAGIGVSAGVQASAGASLEASLGLSASASVGASAGVGAGGGVSASFNAGAATTASVGAGASGTASATQKVNGDQAGKSLSAAGGIGSAIESVKITQSSAAASASVQQFGLDLPVSTAAGGTPQASVAHNVTRGSTAATPMAAISRPPLVKTGSRSYSEQQQARSAPPPPQADPRAVSFGLGAPLRPLYETALSQTQARVCGGPSSNHVIEPPFRTDPTIAPWEALPRRDKARQAVDTLEANKRINPCRVVTNSCDCD